MWDEFKYWTDIFRDLAVGLAALVAVFTYRRSVRMERAKWIKDLYEKFYERTDLKVVRDLLDAQDPQSVQRLVQEESSAFTDYLNFFEFLGYLRASKQITKRELLQLFEYYLRRIEENPPVLAYINDPSKGYEHLRCLMNLVTITPRLFVYGSLMRGFESLTDWRKTVRARLVDTGQIKAHLYDLGEYPGAIPIEPTAEGSVEGEIYELTDPEPAIALLDEYEEFFPLQPDKSLFIRTLTPVATSKGRTQSCWVYFFNHSVEGMLLIPSGDYRKR